MASAPAVTTLIFDLGQVIVHFDHRDLCRKAARYCPHAPENIFTLMFDSGLTHRFETGAITAEVFYREACAVLDMDMALEEFKALWNSIFSLNTDTARILERLKNYRLLLLSNTNRWHFDYCAENYPVLRLFDAWILSCEVGACKPDRKIFEAALSAASVTPQECIFIDDIEAYTDAARNLHMTAHTFTDARHLEEFFKARGIF